MAIPSIQAAADAKFATQVRAQRVAAEEAREARIKEGAKHLRSCRAVQWRTRFAAVEKKLIEVKARLHYYPHDVSSRAECELLEKMYAELLSEQP